MSLTLYIPPSQFKIHSQSLSNASPAIDSSCPTILTICEELSVNIVPREACFTFQLLHLCSQQTWYTEKKKKEKSDSACREHNSSWIFWHKLQCWRGFWAASAWDNYQLSLCSVSYFVGVFMSHDACISDFVRMTVCQECLSRISL